MTTLSTIATLIGESLPPVPDLAPIAGLGPRGLQTDHESSAYTFRFRERSVIWADGVERLYEQAKVRQWNATSDIPWEQGKAVPDKLEEALCTVLTWMVQQEYAAWFVPAKFLPQIHPAFIETALFLSTQVADEARHAEAFTKRVHLNGVGFIGTYAGTEASLAGLLNQEEYDKASFLLHVLGEGTFLDLFAFLRKIAPDEASRTMFIRAHEDEARHVAYGTARLRGQLLSNPGAVDRCVEAIEERVTFAQDVSGLPPTVQESLVTLAAGGGRGLAYAKGFEAVRAFQDELRDNRIKRLLGSGFPEQAANHIAELHAKAAGNAM